MQNFQEFENSELAQTMLELSQIAVKAIASTLVENAIAGNGYELTNEALKELGAILSKKIFEARYGSELSSLMEVGKAKTVKRIEETNEQASFFFQMAMGVIEKMDTAQITAIACQQ